MKKIVVAAFTAALLGTASARLGEVYVQVMPVKLTYKSAALSGQEKVETCLSIMKQVFTSAGLKDMTSKAGSSGGAYLGFVTATYQSRYLITANCHALNPVALVNVVDPTSSTVPSELLQKLLRSFEKR